MRKITIMDILLFCVFCLLIGSIYTALLEIPTSKNAIDVSGKDGSGEVKYVVLADGTKCAVLIGYQKGAISCNWK